MTAHLREAWRVLAAFDVSQLKPGDEVYGYDTILGSEWSHSYQVYVRVVRVNPKTVTVMVHGTGNITRVDHDWIEGYTPQYELDEMGFEAKLQNYTLYHGTNQAALDQIRRDGVFRPMDPEAVNHEIEKRYGLPYDSVWRHKYNSFSHGRVGDPNIYFSTEWDDARFYASYGSEVIADALESVAFILHWDEYVDEEGNFRPGAADKKKAWKEAEVRKHYQPVVLTIQAPLDLVYPPEGTYSIESPIPASWIKRAERV